jgi:hypothetical protein
VAAPKPAPVKAAESQKLIPIRGDGRRPSHPSGPSDPYKFWLEYYRTHDENGEQLRETLRILNASGKTRDVYAVLSGYLTYRQKYREAWMYEAAAMAKEMIGGTPDEVRKFLGYAADLAMKSGNPNDLVSVADKLYLKGWYDRVGELLDAATAKIPHRFEPLVMSINLAQKTDDPVRMGRAIDSLLSLGWPERDDYFRQESRRQAEILAKRLREAGRSSEAEELLARLPDSESRDLYIRLSWSGDAAYDLIVEEPLGATASQAIPRTVFGGAILNDGNLGHPEEIYVCPRAFDGEYRIRVDKTYADSEKPPTRLTLDVITHEGSPQEKKQEFRLDPNRLGDPITIKVADGRRKTVLPFVNPLGLIAPLIEGRRPKRPDSEKPKAPARPEGKPVEPRQSNGKPIKIEP